MSNWKLLNKCRVPRAVDKLYGSSPEDGFNGMFCLHINGLNVAAIVSDGFGWQHVSVSIYQSDMPPSWSVMCQVKDLFWEPEDWVAQFHPAHSEYVNNHPGVLHLWRCTDREFPKPDRLMVGFRDEADIAKVNADPTSPIRIVTIDGTQHSKCELCGKTDELRPYGPKGENICFDCGMKNEKTTSEQFGKLLGGADLFIIK